MKVFTFGKFQRERLQRVGPRGQQGPPLLEAGAAPQPYLVRRRERGAGVDFFRLQMSDKKISDDFLVQRFVLSKTKL
jgi:hypothetical protein